MLELSQVIDLLYVLGIIETSSMPTKCKTPKE